MLYCTRYSLHTTYIQLIEPYLVHSIDQGMEFYEGYSKLGISSHSVLVYAFFCIFFLFLFLSSLNSLPPIIVNIPTNLEFVVLSYLYTTCFFFCYSHLNTVQLRVPTPQGKASPKAYLVQKKLLSNCYCIGTFTNYVDQFWFLR